MKPRQTLIYGLLACTLLALFGYHLKGLQLSIAPPPFDEQFRSLMGGETIQVPGSAGWWRLTSGDHRLLAAVGTRRINREEINLCTQSVGRADNDAIIPVKAGHDWPAVESVVKARRAEGKSIHYGLRNLLIDGGPSGLNIPAFEINGHPQPLVSQQNSPMQIKLRASSDLWLMSDRLPAG